MFQRLRTKPVRTYPGYDELPGVLVVGVNPLAQQRDEAHQVKLVALRHDVLQDPSVSEGTSSTPRPSSPPQPAAFKAHDGEKTSNPR